MRLALDGVQGIQSLKHPAHWKRISQHATQGAPKETVPQRPLGNVVQNPGIQTWKPGAHFLSVLLHKAFLSFAHRLVGNAIHLAGAWRAGSAAFRRHLATPPKRLVPPESLGCGCGVRVAELQNLRMLGTLPALQIFHLNFGPRPRITCHPLLGNVVECQARTRQKKKTGRC